MIDDEQLERLLRARPRTDAAYQPAIADLIDTRPEGQPVTGSLRWRHGNTRLERAAALILVGIAILMAVAMALVGSSRPDRLGVVDMPSPAPTVVIPEVMPNFPVTEVTELLERFKDERWAGTSNVIIDSTVVRDTRIWFAASGPSVFTSTTGGYYPGSTVVRIGALTHLYLATIALRLVDQGRLDLDAPLGRYVSSWPGGNTITVRELLDGSSGVAAFGEPVEALARLVAAEPSRSWTAGDAFRLARDRTPRFQPGARHEAADTEDALLASIIEAVTGSTVWDAFTQEVFGPLFYLTPAPPYPPLPPISDLTAGLWYPVETGGLVEVADLPDDVVAVLGPARNTVFAIADLAQLAHAVHTSPWLLSDTAGAMLDKPFGDGGFGGAAMCPCTGQARNGVGLVGHTGPYTALAVHVPSERLTMAVVANVPISDDDLRELVQAIHDLAWPAIR